MALSTVTTMAPNPAACARWTSDSVGWKRPQPVELEPLRPRVRSGDLLEREPRDRAGDVADAEVRRRLDETDVALGVHEAHAAARRSHHRHRELGAEDFGGRVDLLVVDRVLRAPHEFLEGLNVAAHRVLALGAAVDVVEQATGRNVVTGPSRERPRSSRSARASSGPGWLDQFHSRVTMSRTADRQRPCGVGSSHRGRSPSAQCRANGRRVAAETATLHCFPTFADLSFG